jgi:hypothetical protein
MNVLHRIPLTVLIRTHGPARLISDPRRSFEPGDARCNGA